MRFSCASLEPLSACFFEGRYGSSIAGGGSIYVAGEVLVCTIGSAFAAYYVVVGVVGVVVLEGAGDVAIAVASVRHCCDFGLWKWI